MASLNFDWMIGLVVVATAVVVVAVLVATVVVATVPGVAGVVAEW
jgi:hypothetical protein